jgi:hypothetical protein
MGQLHGLRIRILEKFLRHLHVNLWLVTYPMRCARVGVGAHAHGSTDASGLSSTRAAGAAHADASALLPRNEFRGLRAEKDALIGPFGGSIRPCSAPQVNKAAQLSIHNAHSRSLAHIQSYINTKAR